MSIHVLATQYKDMYSSYKRGHSIILCNTVSLPGLSTCLPIRLSVCLSVRLSVYLFVYLSVYLYVTLSVCLPVYLSVYVFASQLHLVVWKAELDSLVLPSTHRVDFQAYQSIAIIVMLAPKEYVKIHSSICLSSSLSSFLSSCSSNF